jgi:hypothetical protein
MSADPRSRAQRRRDTEHRLTHDKDVWVVSTSADGASYLVPLSFDWDGEALRFYTEKLGFEKRADVPDGGDQRWLTVAPQEEEVIELVLQPPDWFEEEVCERHEGSIGRNPTMVFAVDDCQRTYEELRGRGVEFSSPPTDTGEACRRSLRTSTATRWCCWRSESTSRVYTVSLLVAGAARGRHASPEDAF